MHVYKTIRRGDLNLNFTTTTPSWSKDTKLQPIFKFSLSQFCVLRKGILHEFFHKYLQNKNGIRCGHNLVNLFIEYLKFSMLDKK